MRMAKTMDARSYLRAAEASSEKLYFTSKSSGGKENPTAALVYRLCEEFLRIVELTTTSTVLANLQVH